MSHTLLHKLVPFLHQSGQLGLEMQHTRTLSLRTSAQFFRKGARMNSMNTGAPKDTTLATFACMAGMSANIMKASVPAKGTQCRYMRTHTHFWHLGEFTASAQ
jgi:hypothetical protein